MTAQFENPIRMVRELAGTPITLIFALMCTNHRVNQKWLEATTGFSDKTVSKGLSYLCEIGWVNETSSGWMLIKGKAEQLPMMALLDDPPIQEEQPAGEIIELETDDQIENVELIRRNSDLSTVVVVNNSFKPTTPTDLNLTLRDVKIPDYDEIKQILDAAEELFGQRIMGEPQDYADVDLLLSWIAKAYDGYRNSTKSKVHNPAGLVYWAFHKGKNTKIENKYLDLNKVNLPESFCRASGQWEFEDDHPGGQP